VHELSLCKAIADTATDHAGGRTIERISLQIGHFRQVVPETLQNCWDMRQSDGPLADCVLDVDYVPATIDCAECSETTRLDEPILRCRSCGSTDVVLTSGDEFLILSIDVGPELSGPESEPDPEEAR
jgi:hydrogenase nickel incorporation protein HypA/HybF